MMNPDDHFFVAESVRHAKSLPYSDCLKYLRGMLRACGDIEEVGDLRRVVFAITDQDAQLELIAAGQLKLNLNERPSAGRKGSRR